MTMEIVPASIPAFSTFSREFRNLIPVCRTSTAYDSKHVRHGSRPRPSAKVRSLRRCMR